MSAESDERHRSHLGPNAELTTYPPMGLPSTSIPWAGRPGNGALALTIALVDFSANRRYVSFPVCLASVPHSSERVPASAMTDDPMMG
jgi:hypothetical protein